MSKIKTVLLKWLGLGKLAQSTLVLNGAIEKRLEQLAANDLTTVVLVDRIVDRVLALEAEVEKLKVYKG